VTSSDAETDLKPIIIIIINDALPPVQLIDFSTFE